MAIGSFLRLFVQRLAAEQVQQTVADNLRGAADPRQQDTADQHASGPVNRDAKDRDVPKRELLPCHAGVVFALAMESGYLEDRLSGVISIKGHGFTVRTGGLNGRGVAVLTSGHSQAAARRGTEALIAGHRPRWVISAGFAGGLQPDIKRADIVMADSITGERGERMSIDLRIRADGPPGRGVHVGRLLSVDRVIRTSEEKRRLGDEHNALAVDMESLAVAQVCQREKQRFLGIRAITDTVDEELPRDVERLLNRPTMARKFGAAAGSLIRRPSAAKDLWKLRESAITAADRLAKYLASVIEQLPP